LATPAVSSPAVVSFWARLRDSAVIFGDNVLQRIAAAGNLDDAIYWAVDLDLSGFSDWLWRRIKIIASEDIGPGEPTPPLQVDTLHRWWQESKKKQGHPYERLHLVHAIVLCCRATKSRLVPNILLAHYMDHDGQHREVPDYALDMHTVRGKRKGRGTIVSWMRQRRSSRPQKSSRGWRSRIASGSDICTKSAFRSHRDQRAHVTEWTEERFRAPQRVRSLRERRSHRWVVHTGVCARNRPHCGSNWPRASENGAER
jgi:hypothetical protein